MPIQFDSREYTEALEPPVFFAPNGKKYVGKLMSYEKWLAFSPLLEGIDGREDLTMDELSHIARTLTDAMFPHPFWKFWRRPASHYVLRLPPIFMLKAIMSFMEAQGQWRTVLEKTLGDIGMDTEEFNQS